MYSYDSHNVIKPPKMIVKIVVFIVFVSNSVCTSQLRLNRISSTPRPVDPRDNVPKTDNTLDKTNTKDTRHIVPFAQPLSQYANEVYTTTTKQADVQTTKPDNRILSLAEARARGYVDEVSNNNDTFIFTTQSIVQTSTTPPRNNSPLNDNVVQSNNICTDFRVQFRDNCQQNVIALSNSIDCYYFSRSCEIPLGPPKAEANQLCFDLAQMYTVECRNSEVCFDSSKHY
jgi:hypothetical protein